MQDGKGVSGKEREEEERGQEKAEFACVEAAVATGARSVLTRIVEACDASVEGVLEEQARLRASVEKLSVALRELDANLNTEGMDGGKAATNLAERLGGALDKSRASERQRDREHVHLC